jgi:hypothetical protein
VVSNNDDRSKRRTTSSFKAAGPLSRAPSRTRRRRAAPEADNNQPSPCADWTTSASIAGADSSCIGGPGGALAAALPAALFRGGVWNDGTSAGVFAVNKMLGEQGVRGISRTVALFSRARGEGA